MLVFVVTLLQKVYEVDKAVYESVKELYDSRKVEKLSEKDGVVKLKGRHFMHLDVELSNTVEDLKKLIELFEGETRPRRVGPVSCCPCADQRLLGRKQEFLWTSCV